MRILSCRCEIETYGKGSEKLAETEINTAKKVVVGGWYLLLFYVMSESYLCPRTTEPMFMCH